jgi:hypothetical protein
MQVMPHDPSAELRFELEPDHRVKENHIIRVKAAFLNLTQPAPRDDDGGYRSWT